MKLLVLIAICLVSPVSCLAASPIAASDEQSGRGVRSKQDANNIHLSNVIPRFNTYHPIPEGADLLEAESNIDNDVIVATINQKQNRDTFVYQAKPSSDNSASNVDEEETAKKAEEKIANIAHNSREVRLVGPNQKAVEMKDDVGTKFMIAMDNFSKEASEVWGKVNKEAGEVWGQVNEKLDKGWTDFKQMIEGAMAPASNKKPSNNNQY